MNKSLVRYMISDLLILTIIGCILEFLCNWLLSGTPIMSGTPFAFLSFLILFLAIARWKLWGLIVIPFLSLATLLGGNMAMLTKIKDVYSFTYNWQFFISYSLSFLIMGINVLFYRKGTKRIVTSTAKILGIAILDYLLVNILQIILYRLLVTGGIIERGHLLNSLGNDEICAYSEGGLIYNLYGFGILIIGIFIFRSQGVLCNAKEKLLDDKKELELNLKDLNFKIEDGQKVSDENEALETQLKSDVPKEDGKSYDVEDK